MTNIVCYIQVSTVGESYCYPVNFLDVLTSTHPLTANGFDSKLLPKRTKTLKDGA